MALQITKQALGFDVPYWRIEFLHFSKIHNKLTVHLYGFKDRDTAQGNPATSFVTANAEFGGDDYANLLADMETGKNIFTAIYDALKQKPEWQGAVDA